MVRLFLRQLKPPSATGVDGAGKDPSILDEHSFRRELASELSRAKRGSGRLSIVVGLLGSPGEYDFVGQRTADPRLEAAARTLVEQKREIDVVASLGQGRFVLILPETGEPGALVAAERLKTAIAAAYGAESEAPLGFGVATFGRHGRSANALLRAAERAARAAKELDHRLLIQRHRDGETIGSATRHSADADTQAA
jgi:diguanylate cyclase (GGDEF)-like protein